jgi:hypothetical protein
MSTQLAQIARKAKLDRKVRFTSLAHLLTPEFLKETWGRLNRRGASGIDGKAPSSLKASWNNGYRKSARLKAGVYRAHRCGG